VTTAASRTSQATLRGATPEDGAAVAAIYNYYIRETVVTFETEPVEDSVMTGRIAEALADGLPYLVAMHDGKVAGFAYASKWKGRCAYRYSVESTVYLDPGCTGGGIGTQLYRALIDEIRALNMHAVIGGISLPNDASVALHEKLGFKKVGQFSEVGFKFDRWVDVGYWQLTLQGKR
jgi:phosphinothricin acetyltransferase